MYCSKPNIVYLFNCWCKYEKINTVFDSRCSSYNEMRESFDQFTGSV